MSCVHSKKCVPGRMFHIVYFNQLQQKCVQFHFKSRLWKPTEAYITHAILSLSQLEKLYLCPEHTTVRLQ